MIITNHANLPDPVVRAVSFSNRDREGADYTITELIQPPRILALRRQHDAELSEDASERIWALLGSASHEILRRSAAAGIVEQRTPVEFAVDGKRFLISGQPDYCVNDDVLWDYKLTKVYAVKDGPKREWEQQLNCYRWLLHHYGIEMKRLCIVVFFTDWSKREVRRNPDYPQLQTKVFNLARWDDATVVNFLQKRIRVHEAAKRQLPECTPEEMWEKPVQFAVMKRNGKRARRVYRNYAEADRDRLELGAQYEIETRPAERVRCEDYCPVNEFCDFFQQWKNKQ